MATTEKWAKLFKSRHQYADGVPIQLGAAKDVAVQFDGTNLTIKPVTDDTGQIIVGDGTTDMDFKIFMGTTAKHVLFDQSAALVTFTATALTMGANTAGVDVTLHGTTTGNYLLWDASEDDLLLVGTATQLAVAGTTESTSTTTGSLRTAGGLACVGDFYAGDDIFLTSGAVLNFNAGDMTITHSSNDLAIAGGTLTTAGIIVGTVATGISFTGTYTGNVIDFTSATIAPTGSAGPCFIRAGAYGSPVDLGVDEDQSGMIRMYVTTSAGGTSYDRGLFMFCETTGTKGIMPVAGLAEVGAGGAPTAVYPCQFIAHLNSATASLGASAQMFGGWFKITANDGATIPSTARAAPLWLDNQLYGANAATIGEEYTIFSTTGGTVPKAWAGFETTSSGWDQLFYFDETMAAAEPFVSTGCSVTIASVPYLKVLVNATQYGIPLIAI
uniref:Uncharacterized protein n=1 Tax=viral metagenome TaxID=1070528 RepID=A0A6M3J0H2_9ZZZZ